MTAKSISADADLSARCLAILRYHGKPMDSVHLGRLLKEDSSSCYRALCSIPGVIADKTGSLTKFSVAPC